MSEDNFSPVKFVGFTNEQSTFKNLLALQADPRYHLPVLCFYGVGGVGKSWLCSRFGEFLTPASLNLVRCAPFSVVNYQQEDTLENDYPKLLYQIFSDLKKYPGFKNCPEFDTAYSLYLENSGRGKSHAPDLSTYQPRSLKGLELLLPTAIASPALLLFLTQLLMNQFEWGEAETKAVLGVVGVSASFIAFWVFKWIEKSAVAAEKKRNRYYATYNAMGTAAIKASLPEALANDLNRADLDSHPQCQAVVIFDALEQLDGKVLTKGSQQEWIAKFARLSKRTLVVVTGHNALSWDEPEREWTLDAKGKEWWMNDKKQPERNARRFEQRASGSEVWRTNCDFFEARLIQ